MNLRLVSGLSVTLCAGLVHAGPAEDLSAAAAKVAAAPSYAWTVTMEFANSQFPAVPVQGVTEKGGCTVTTMTFNGNTRQTVRQGDQVSVFFPDLNKEITTRVKYVSKTINPNTRTFTVECNLPAGPEYRANMVAVMKIIDYQKPNSIVIPVNLIQNAEDGEFVMVADKSAENKAVARKVNVKAGNNYNGNVEILSGLKKGDFVISTGFQDVNNGETIAF